MGGSVKIGQVYKIKHLQYRKASDAFGRLITTNATLIFKSKYFYTFEYKAQTGDKLRATISTFEYMHNPGMIKEVV